MLQSLAHFHSPDSDNISHHQSHNFHDFLNIQRGQFIWEPYSTYQDYGIVSIICPKCGQQVKEGVQCWITRNKIGQSSYLGHQGCAIQGQYFLQFLDEAIKINPFFYKQKQHLWVGSDQYYGEILIRHPYNSYKFHSKTVKMYDNTNHLAYDFGHSYDPEFSNYLLIPLEHFTVQIILQPLKNNENYILINLCFNVNLQKQEPGEIILKYERDDVKFTGIFEVVRQDSQKLKFIEKVQYKYRRLFRSEKMVVFKKFFITGDFQDVEHLKALTQKNIQQIQRYSQLMQSEFEQEPETQKLGPSAASTPESFQSKEDQAAILKERTEVQVSIETNQAEFYETINWKPHQLQLQELQEKAKENQNQISTQINQCTALENIQVISSQTHQALVQLKVKQNKEETSTSNSNSLKQTLQNSSYNDNDEGQDQEQINESYQKQLEQSISSSKNLINQRISETTSPSVTPNHKYYYFYMNFEEYFDEKQLVSEVKTQAGSKDFQSRTPSLTHKEIGNILLKLKSYLKQLILSDYSNYMVQAIFMRGDPLQKKFIIQNIGQHIYEIARTKEGTFVLQEFLQASCQNNVNVICHYIFKNFTNIATDFNGHHLIRKLCQSMSQQTFSYILYFLNERFSFYMGHKHAVFIISDTIQRLKSFQNWEKIQNLPEFYKFLQQLNYHFGSLINHQYGNYLAQKILQVIGLERLQNVYYYIMSNFFTLSCQKYASNVVISFLRNYCMTNQACLNPILNSLDISSIDYLSKVKEGTKVLNTISEFLDPDDPIRVNILKKTCKQYTKGKGKHKAGKEGENYNYNINCKTVLPSKRRVN